MTDPFIIEKAMEEVEHRTFGVTEQFLAVHRLVYADGKPKVASVDAGKDDRAVVYFAVEGETFFSRCMWT